MTAVPRSNSGFDVLERMWTCRKLKRGGGMNLSRYDSLGFHISSFSETPLENHGPVDGGPVPGAGEEQELPAASELRLAPTCEHLPQKIQRWTGMNKKIRRFVLCPKCNLCPFIIAEDEQEKM